ncbi:MAG: hypothetical protein JWL68_6367 [Actinomycetia bacterium]|nr:hypothetical protein [Actinomycetes bacterium]
MNIDINVPDEWTPGLTLAIQQSLQHAVRSGRPLITCLSPDATAEQIEAIDHQIRALVQDSGLAA